MKNDANTPELEQDETKIQDEQPTESQEEAQPQEESTNDTDWKAEALKYKAILERNKSKKAESKPASAKKKSDGLDYGQKAFLATQGIKGSKEFDFVQQELNKSGRDIEELLENAYFKSELDNFRSLNKADAATPQGNRSGSPALDSVDYWMAKPIGEVPADMRIKVVNAKLKQEKTKGVFYNSGK